MKKLDRKDNFDLFVKALKEEAFFVINGLNPCLINYKGQSFYVYIKTLTPAQLSNNNPDVWRCQLPKQKSFDVIKNSSYKFILLGYDAENDVYATWNLYWAKQRLNVGSSVSMYSRLSLQIKASQNNEIIRYSLNRQGEVLIFPRTLLPDYLDNIQTYFPEETKYIAIGSSLRTNSISEHNTTAIELYEDYISVKSFEKFKSYMLDVVDCITLKTRKSYIRYIEYINEHHFFEKYKEAFLEFSSIDEYEKANQAFLSEEEIAFIDRPGKGGWHGAIKAALKYYLAAYIYYKTKTSEEEDNTITNNEENDSSVSDETDKPNILASGIKERIVPLMCQEEPDIMGSLQIISEYFGDKYNDTMQFQDWLRLLKSIDWFKYSSNKDNYVFPIDKETSINTVEDFNKIILFYANEILNIPVNKRREFIAPHIYILLLSILSLISTNEIKSSFIEISKKLIETFDNLWAHLVPYNSPYKTPMFLRAFFDLAKASFWVPIPHSDVAVSEPTTLEMLIESYKGVRIPDILFNLFRFKDTNKKFYELITSLLSIQQPDNIEKSIKKKFKYNKKDHKTLFYFLKQKNNIAIPDKISIYNISDYYVVIYKNINNPIIVDILDDTYECNHSGHFELLAREFMSEDIYMVIGDIVNGIIETNNITAYKVHSSRGTDKILDYWDADYYAASFIPHED